MARPTVRRASSAVLPVNDRRSAPGLDVVAPLDVHAAGGQGAAALSQALGLIEPVGQQYAKDAMEKDAARGQLDSQSGVVDSKKLQRSRAYADAYVSSKADAEFADFKSELVKWYDSDFDKLKGTPQDLDAQIIEKFKQKYGAVDDARIAKAVAPKLQEFREALGARQLEVTRKAVQDEHTSNVSKIIEDNIASGKAVDLEDAKARLGAVLPGGRAEAVRTLGTMIGQIAIRRKDPDLIDALIPEKWADGTPGPFSLPDVAEQLNKDRYYADGQRDALNNENDRQARKAAAAKSNQIANDIAIGAMNGEDMTQTLIENKGLFDDGTFRALASFNHQKREENQKGEPGSPTAIASVEYKMMTGVSGIQDLVKLANEGDLGTGEELRQNMTQLLKFATDAQEYNSKKRTDANYRYYADLIEGALPVSKDIGTGMINENEAARQRMAVTRYHELTQKDMAPAEAYKAVVADLPKLHDKNSMSFDPTAPASATELTQVLRTKNFPAEWRAKYTAVAIGKLHDSGELDDTQAEQILNLLD